MSDGAEVAAPGFVWLASQSPRRRQLLDQIGVAHRLLLPDADEDAEALEAERAGESPERYVERVTLAKLGAARLRLVRRGGPLAPILCADTTVALGRRILGKPFSTEHAERMLTSLSGRTHRVLTAISIAWPNATNSSWSTSSNLSVSLVRVAKLEAESIARYVRLGDSLGKAGAYGIQGPFAVWIEHINGSYSGIMGLPLFEVSRLLRNGPPTLVTVDR